MKTIETRFTVETGPTPRTYWPLGIFDNWTCDWERFDLTHNAREPFWLRPAFNGVWASIEYGDGTPMYKFIMPTEVTEDYKTVRFIFNGIWYVLEVRIAHIDNK